jgi:protein subunit release factor A
MEARAELRSLAHGTGDRSDKIRTYNFPQDRVTDHRVGCTATGVDRVMAGIGLDSILDALLAADEDDRLKNFIENLESKSGHREHVRKK